MKLKKNNPDDISCLCKIIGCNYIIGQFEFKFELEGRGAGLNASTGSPNIRDWGLNYLLKR